MANPVLGRRRLSNDEEATLHDFIVKYAENTTDLEQRPLQTIGILITDQFNAGVTPERAISSLITLNRIRKLTKDGILAYIYDNSRNIIGLDLMQTPENTTNPPVRSKRVDLNTAMTKRILFTEMMHRFAQAYTETGIKQITNVSQIVTGVMDNPAFAHIVPQSRRTAINHRLYPWLHSDLVTKGLISRSNVGDHSMLVLTQTASDEEMAVFFQELSKPAVPDFPIPEGHTLKTYAQSVLDRLLADGGGYITLDDLRNSPEIETIIPATIFEECIKLHPHEVDYAMIRALIQENNDQTPITDESILGCFNLFCAHVGFALVKNLDTSLRTTIELELANFEHSRAQMLSKLVMLGEEYETLLEKLRVMELTMLSDAHYDQRLATLQTKITSLEQFVGKPFVKPAIVNLMRDTIAKHTAEIAELNRVQHVSSTLSDQINKAKEAYDSLEVEIIEMNTAIAEYTALLPAI